MEWAVAVAAASATALLYRLAFTLDASCCLVWVAFVPLILATIRFSPTTALLYGWFSGALLNLTTSAWVFEVPGVGIHHGLMLAAYLGIFPAIWCLIVASVWRSRAPFLLAVPAAWVILDFLRAHAGPMAISWATPAYWQHTNPAILQLAAYTGEYGVTFLVMLVNAAIALSVRERRWTALARAGGLVAGAVVLGTLVLRADSSSEMSLRVAVVQPAFSVEEMKTLGGAEKLDILEGLTLQASNDEPNVIVWPEAAVHDWRRDPNLLLRIASIAEESGTSIVLGMSESGKSVRDQGAGQWLSAATPFFRNTAVMISDTGHFAGVYHKNRLVPFSEFSPFDGLPGRPDWIPKPAQPMTAGIEQAQFRLPGNISVIPIICWENLFAGYVRRAVTTDASLVLHLVNDNWAGQSPAARQHNAASVVRAVENRIPFVTASNTGPSQIIDAHGRVIAEIPDLFVRGVVAAEVQVPRDRSFYHQAGDWFVVLCALLLAAGLNQRRGRRS
ncbi:MAG TPA: apolipoprotein N-acyltransferase [Thiocapsa sp.]|nr:apolipoprotein N-acyltransferase [Thiocapsa sp.]